MSERQFFSLRYAIPGYTLILLVIGINHVPLLKFLEITGFEAALGAFLAFLTLFTGSALGFLVSQFWWWWYRKKGGLYGIPEFREVLDAFIGKFGLPDRYKNPQENAEKLEVIAVYDYVSYSVVKKKKELLVYSERRWDMYLLLKSTLLTLEIGLGLGFLGRLFSQLSLFSSSNPSGVVNVIAELIVLALISVSVVLLVKYILPEAVHWTIFEYAAVAKARIRTSDVKPEDLKEAFPEVFSETRAPQTAN